MLYFSYINSLNNFIVCLRCASCILEYLSLIVKMISQEKYYNFYFKYVENKVQIG